jgi:hypothetical protein
LFGQVPLFTIAEDPNVDRGHNVLYVPATMAEVILLRSLGVPAAPATRLEQLNRREIEHLLHRVDGIARKPIASRRLRSARYAVDQSYYLGREKERPAELQLALVGCNLSSGHSVIHPQTLDAAQHLAMAQRALGITWSGLYFWWPSEMELEFLDYRRRLGDVELVQAFFRQPTSLYRVSDFADPAKRPEREQSFVAVFDALVHAARELKKHRSNGTEFLRKLADYRKRVDREIFGPLMDTALEIEDPRIRVLRSSLAHVTRLLHRMMPGIYAAADGNMERCAATDDGYLPEAAHKQMEKLVNATIRLVKAEAQINEREGPSSDRWGPRRHG